MLALEASKRMLFTVAENLSYPPINLTVPVNSYLTRRVVPSHREILGVGSASYETEVLYAIIKAIMIYMVNLRAFWDHPMV